MMVDSAAVKYKIVGDSSGSAARLPLVIFRKTMATIKIDPTLHQHKKPDWIKVRLPSNPVFFSTKGLI